MVFKITEEAYRAWDVIIKVISLVIAIVVFYEGTQALKNHYSSKIWEKQLEIYTEVIDAAAGVASTDHFENNEEFKQSKKEFLQLFYGKANLIADKDVESKLVDFKDALIDLDIHLERGSSEKVIDVQSKGIQAKSVELAKECKRSSMNSWNSGIDNF